MPKKTVTLQPGESKEVVFTFTPTEARSYQVIVDGLSGSFNALPIIPEIKLTNLVWDAVSPFEPGSRHIWAVTVQNLAARRLTYQLEMYLNDVWVMGDTANLAAGEVGEISQPFTFGVEGTYTLSIKAFHEGELLDEISSTVSVEVPPAPDVVEGEFLIAYIWWEGLPGWRQMTLAGNRWPAMTSIEMRFKVRNTGNITATFQVNFAGKISNAIDLAPGESGFVELRTETPTPGASGTFDAILYANGQDVDHFTIEWEVY